jgi:hypothetical protein
MNNTETYNIFDKVFLPKSFLEINIFMFDCGNVANIMECINRKCLSFVGFDTYSVNIDTANTLISQNKLSRTELLDVLFVNTETENVKKTDMIRNVYGTADLIFYNTRYNQDTIDDNLYDFLSNISNDVCIYETQQDIDCEVFKSTIKSKGFEMVISINKNIFIMKKKRNILSRRLHNNMYDHIVSRYYDFVVTENTPYIDTKDPDLLKKYKIMELYVQECYDKIKHIIFIGETTFINSVSFSKYYNSYLHNRIKTQEWLNIVKTQLVELVRSMNKIGIAHRDIHIENICIDTDNTIKLIDFEYLCENICDLKDCYDLTGSGIESPIYIYWNVHTYIFSESKISLRNYFNGQLTIDDFSENH